MGKKPSFSMNIGKNSIVNMIRWEILEVFMNFLPFEAAGGLSWFILTECKNIIFKFGIQIFMIQEKDIKVCSVSIWFWLCVFGGGGD